MTAQEQNGVVHFVDDSAKSSRLQSAFTRCGVEFTYSGLTVAVRTDRGTLLPHYYPSVGSCNCIRCMVNELHTTKRSAEVFYEY